MTPAWSQLGIGTIIPAQRCTIILYHVSVVSHICLHSTTTTATTSPRLDEGRWENERGDEGNAQETSYDVSWASGMVFFFPFSFYFDITNFFYRFNALIFWQPPPVCTTTGGSRPTRTTNGGLETRLCPEPSEWDSKFEGSEWVSSKSKSNTAFLDLLNTILFDCSERIYLGYHNPLFLLCLELLVYQCFFLSFLYTLLMILCT